MIPQHVLIGVGVVVLCIMGLIKERWFLENSANGRRLVHWCGATAAPTVFKGLMAMAIVFGALLAAGIIRPIQW